jgi:hypothetical protein
MIASPVSIQIVKLLYSVALFLFRRSHDQLGPGLAPYGNPGNPGNPSPCTFDSQIRWNAVAFQQKKSPARATRVEQMLGYSQFDECLLSSSPANIL